MSRAHDIGGQTGFGAVAPDEDGRPFAADWEARVYALNTVLRRRGLYGTDQMRDAIEQIPPQQYLAASYYERWLLAIEALLGRHLPAAGETGRDGAGDGAGGAEGDVGGD